MSEPTTPATAFRAAADIADSANAFGAGADDRQTRLALQGIITGLGWLSYYVLVVPSTFLFNATLWTLRILYSPIGFALRPFVYIGRLGLAVLMLPVKIVMIYEDFFTYLAVAAILGLLGGLIIRLLFSWLRTAMHLDDREALNNSKSPKTGSKPYDKPSILSNGTDAATTNNSSGRTVEEYRESRRNRQQAASTAGYISPVPPNDEALAAWSSSASGYLSPTGSTGSGGGYGSGKATTRNGGGKNGLIAQTILEEGDDSDF